MTDTSLISNAAEETTQTDNNTADTSATENQNTDEGNTSAKSDAETLFPNTSKNEEEGNKEDDKASDKPEEDKSDGDKDSEDDAAKDKEDDKEEGKEGEPLDLSDLEFELPEGVEISSETLTELGELTGKMNLTKEQAAEFVPFGAKVIERTLQAQQEQYKQTRSEWRDQVAADKEIGGADEAARKEKLATAFKGLEAIGSPELRTLLDQTGIGDHPEVIRAFYKAGLSASEDNIEQGGSGSKSGNYLDTMYPSMAAKQ